MSAYGECLLESHGGRPVVKKADKRVLVSDAFARLRDGNLLRLGSDHPLGIGVVTYELVAWDADAHAHVAVRVDKAPPPKARPQRGGPAR